MIEAVEASLNIEHIAADRCPYYDNDCKLVLDHVSCWSGLDTDHPFPGVCPFVFGLENITNN